ncbi:hypothetical protein E4U25_000179 [Claviceps purpurea]|nr:hypothetical protein E4U36_003100 [Claviceps purpurea]KAG6239913.1 hypothetical protein E4U25_000179 [Claviceps purpurea]
MSSGHVKINQLRFGSVCHTSPSLTSELGVIFKKRATTAGHDFTIPPFWATLTRTIRSGGISNTRLLNIEKMGFVASTSRATCVQIYFASYITPLSQRLLFHDGEMG